MKISGFFLLYSSAWCRFVSIWMYCGQYLFSALKTACRLSSFLLKVWLIEINEDRERSRRRWRWGNSHRFFCMLWNSFPPAPPTSPPPPLLYLSSSSSILNDSMLAVQLCVNSNNTNSSTMRHKWNVPLESAWKYDNRRYDLPVFFRIPKFCSSADCCRAHDFATVYFWFVSSSHSTRDLCYV